jgi:ubiquinone/menaquinone biosynthesis C-methylase UbiE
MANQERVKEFFGRHAAAYAVNPGFRKGDDLARLVEALHPSPSDTALDVATAAGHTAFALAERAGAVVGLDLTPEMEGEFTRGAAERGLSNVRFQLGEVDAMPFPAGSFDLVTCRRAGHHFPDVGRAVAEMARVLRPGGRLGIIDMTAPSEPSIAFMNRLEIARDPSHVRACTPDEWRRHVEDAGLQVEIAEVQGEPMPWERWLHPVTPDSAEGREAESIAVEAAHGEKREIIQESGAGRLFMKRRIVLTARKP